MRSLFEIITSALLMAFSLPVLATDTFPDALVVHVPENCEGGHVAADLRELFSLDRAGGVRALFGNDCHFHIDDADRLIVTGSPPLDHETNAEHRLLVEVALPVPSDSLRDRFTSVVTAAGAGEESAARLKQTRKTVSLHVIVDDCNEPPRLLTDNFWSVSPTEVAPGRAVGRVVATDPDRNDRLQFGLVGSHPLLRIDTDSGVVWIRDEVHLPAVARIHAAVRVVDVSGLAHSRPLQIRLNRAARMPVAPPDQSPVADANSDEPTSEPTELSTEGVEAAIVTADIARPSSDEDLSSGFVPDAISAEVNADVPVSDMAELVPPQSAASEKVTARSAVIADDPALGLRILAIVIGLGIGILAFGWSMRVRSGFAGESRSGDSLVDSPSEIDAILLRLENLRAELDESRDTAARGSAEDDPASAILSVDEFMSDVLSSSGFSLSGEQSAASAVATIASPATTRQIPATDSPGHAAETAGHPTRRAADQQRPGERDRLEEFRRISRSTNRADISRHHREQMVEEWMSLGLTAAACIVTGTVCLFTECLGKASVPCGTVLLSVSATLLMRPSLYPEQPRRRATDRLE